MHVLLPATLPTASQEQTDNWLRAPHTPVAATGQATIIGKPLGRKAQTLHASVRSHPALDGGGRRVDIHHRYCTSGESQYPSRFPASGEEAHTNPIDLALFQESALDYAMAIRAAMSQYRRSGHMRIVEHAYRVCTITRGSPAGPLANVRTPEAYASSFSCSHQTSEYRHKQEWDMYDKYMFMQRLLPIQLGRDVLLNRATQLGLQAPEKAPQLADQIMATVLQPSGRVPSRPRVEGLVRQLTSIFLGNPTSWRVEAEINGVWPEGESIRLAAATMKKVWAVTYRDDVDAVQREYDFVAENVPDAEIVLMGSGVASQDLEHWVRVVVRVLTLFGPTRVWLVRYSRSKLATTRLEPAMAAPDRFSGGGQYCIHRTETSHCRRFVQRIVPVLDATLGALQEGSMQRVGVSAMDLYEDGLKNHPDIVGGIAMKVVCLESMFLSDEPNGELSYRLSQHVALTLALVAGMDAFQVAGDICDAYGVRSGFFHGHVRRKTLALATRELDDRLGRYCRTSISLFLQSGNMKRDEFLRDLDAGALDEQRRRTLQKRIQGLHLVLPLTVTNG